MQEGRVIVSRIVWQMIYEGFVVADRGAFCVAVWICFWLCVRLCCPALSVIQVCGLFLNGCMIRGGLLFSPNRADRCTGRDIHRIQKAEDVCQTHTAKNDSASAQKIRR